MSDSPIGVAGPPEPLAAFVREMQAEMWHDLDEAIRSAINGVWSIAASQRAARIVQAARLVGPSDTGEVPWNLVSGGVYEAVLTAGGVVYEMPDQAEMERRDVMMSKYGPLGKEPYISTVAEIQRPRESLFINGA